MDLIIHWRSVWLRERYCPPRELFVGIYVHVLRDGQILVYVLYSILSKDDGTTAVSGIYLYVIFAAYSCRAFVRNSPEARSTQWTFAPSTISHSAVAHEALFVWGRPVPASSGLCSSKIPAVRPPRPLIRETPAIGMPAPLNHTNLMGKPG